VRSIFFDLIRGFFSLTDYCTWTFDSYTTQRHLLPSWHCSQVSIVKNVNFQRIWTDFSPSSLAILLEQRMPVKLSFNPCKVRLLTKLSHKHQKFCLCIRDEFILYLLHMTWSSGVKIYGHENVICGHNSQSLRILFNFGLLMILPLHWSAIVFAYLPCFDRWLGAKSHWLVNSWVKNVCLARHLRFSRHIVFWCILLTIISNSKQTMLC
jgi:hypothetical protein